MLLMSWYCENCKASDIVEDVKNLDGCCPKCLSHKGEVRYECDNSIADFMDILSNMDDKNLVEYGEAIRECARYFVDHVL